jgi:hypothetical protein
MAPSPLLRRTHPQKILWVGYIAGACCLLPLLVGLFFLIFSLVAPQDSAAPTVGGDDVVKAALSEHWYGGPQSDRLHAYRCQRDQFPPGAWFGTLLQSDDSEELVEPSDKRSSTEDGTRKGLELFGTSLAQMEIYRSEPSR